MPNPAILNDVETPVPVQGQDPQPVPFWVAALAHADYVRQFGDRQTLATIIDRGGFGQNELIEHLANLARSLLEGKEPAS